MPGRGDRGGVGNQPLVLQIPIDRLPGLLHILEEGHRGPVHPDDPHILNRGEEVEQRRIGHRPPDGICIRVPGGGVGVVAFQDGAADQVPQGVGGDDAFLDPEDPVHLDHVRLDHGPGQGGLLHSLIVVGYRISAFRFARSIGNYYVVPPPPFRHGRHPQKEAPGAAAGPVRRPPEGGASRDEDPHGPVLGLPEARLHEAGEGYPQRGPCVPGPVPQDQQRRGLRIPRDAVLHPHLPDPGGPRCRRPEPTVRRAVHRERAPPGRAPGGRGAAPLGRRLRGQGRPARREHGRGRGRPRYVPPPGPARGLRGVAAPPPGGGDAGPGPRGSAPPERQLALRHELEGGCRAGGAPGGEGPAGLLGHRPDPARLEETSGGGGSPEGEGGREGAPVPRGPCGKHSRR